MKLQQLYKAGVLLLLVTFMFIVTPLAGQAAPHQMLFLNGNSISLPEPLKIMNNSTMVPIRVVSEELGYEVIWDQKQQKVDIQSESNSIQLVINNKQAKVNGKQVSLDTPPAIVNNSTLVPLRFVGESLGLVVDWDKTTKSVYLFTAEEQVEVTLPGAEAGNNGSSETDSGVTQPSETKPELTVPGADPSTGQEQGNGSGEAGLDHPATPETADALILDLAFIDNTLHIALDKSVQPVISTLTNPDRVIIDLSNAVFSDQFRERFVLDSNSQGGINITEYPDVQRVRYAMFEQSTNVARFVVDGNYALAYETLSSSDDLVSIKFSPMSDSQSSQPVYPEQQKDSYTIVIDAGHGKDDSGAVSVAGRYEKDVNLSIALKVAELASNEEKVNVVLTRSEDTSLKLPERVAIANDMNSDLFVSIHGNSVENNASVSGTETYYYREESKALADVIHRYLIEGTQFADRGVKKASHHVTRETNMPAILLEIGFLSNPVEEEEMHAEAFQWRVAEHIIAGLKEYLGVN